MHDTKNLQKRMKEYASMARKYRIKRDFYQANYWAKQAYDISCKIVKRNKNKKKNEKQYRKAN